MKRVILNLYPHLLVPDDIDPIDLANTLVDALAHTDGLEHVRVARSRTLPVREGICRVGAHPFHVGVDFPADREVPDICPSHAYEAELEDAANFHEPLVDEVERLTGMKGSIWQSGGMTMSIVFPLNEPADGEDWSVPLYIGLVESHTDAGEWLGNVQYFETDQDAEHDDGVDVVFSREGALFTPAQWAEAIAAHYATLTGPASPR